MKTARYLFAVIALGASLLGRGDAHGNGNDVDSTPAKSIPLPPVSSPAKHLPANDVHPPVNKAAKPEKPSGLFPVGTARFGTVRNPNAAPAAIGGLTAASARRSAAALNGTAIKGRP